MSNIEEHATRVEIHDGFQTQWVTDVLLNRPVIQWKSMERGWQKTRRFWVSSVVLDPTGILGGPFIETMAFPTKGGMGFGLYQARTYFKDFGGDLNQFLVAGHNQHIHAIRQVAKGGSHSYGL